MLGEFVPIPKFEPLNLAISVAPFENLIWLLPAPVLFETRLRTPLNYCTNAVPWLSFNSKVDVLSPLSRVKSLLSVAW